MGRHWRASARGCRRPRNGFHSGFHRYPGYPSTLAVSARYRILRNDHRVITLGRLHDTCQQTISRFPCLLHLSRDVLTQTLLERPQQCGPNRFVVLVPYAVTRMTPAKAFNCRNELVEIVEPFHHHSDHLHQLPTLREISPEESTQGWVERELR